MKLKSIIICILILSLSFAVAEKLPPQVIQAAVQTWVREVTADARPEAMVESMKPYVIAGDTVAYIAGLNDYGYCVTGVCDEMLPVYFYSPAGEFDFNDARYSQALGVIWEASLDFIESLSQAGEKSQKARETAASRREYWEDLAAERVLRSHSSMEFYDGPDSMHVPNFPLWGGNQRWPMNALTPYIITSTGPCTLRTVDGCVAHSMAMIMRTWEWPVIGQGADTTYYDKKTSPLWIATTLNFYPFVPGFDTLDCVWRNRIEWMPRGETGVLRIQGDW
ncbi:C10 family peptidase, partial [bacterium]|nr:C10 family peptidase [bacterium]